MPETVSAEAPNASQPAGSVTAEVPDSNEETLKHLQDTITKLEATTKELQSDNEVLDKAPDKARERHQEAMFELIALKQEVAKTKDHERSMRLSLVGLQHNGKLQRIMQQALDVHIARLSRNGCEVWFASSARAECRLLLANLIC